MKKVVITSEAQAFQLLEKALKHEISDKPLELKFDGWPVVSIRLKGPGYDATINSDIAEAVIQLQRAVNRTYARSARGLADSRSLTDTERREVQFKAKVKRGSSLIEINLGDFAEKLATTITSKMSPEMLVLTVLGITVTGASLLAYKAFLRHRSEDKQIEQSARDRMALSEQETKRMQIMADALTRVPALRHTRADFDEAREEILRSGSNAQSIEVNDLEIAGDAARVISRARRGESEEQQANGNYLILATDLRQPDEIRLRVRSLDNGREFLASFKDQTLQRSQIRLLQDAEWSRGPVYLSINARLLRGQITAATVISVTQQPLVDDEEL